MDHGRTFVYQSDFDENGLLFWIGTQGKTKCYANPHTAGSVVVTPSSVDVGGAAGFIGHRANRGAGANFTRNDQGSTVSVQVPAGFIVTRYTLRHGSNSGSNFLRHWNLEASIDGVNYTVLGCIRRGRISTANTT
jgi:E3 ubiquitin-protein ligase HECTD1